MRHKVFCFLLFCTEQRLIETMNFYYILSMNCCFYELLCPWIVVSIVLVFMALNWFDNIKLVCLAIFMSKNCLSMNYIIFKMPWIRIVVFMSCWCLWMFVPMNCYVQELLCLWIIMSKDCYVYELLCLWIVVSMNCCIYELLCLWIVVAMNCCVYELLCHWVLMSMISCSFKLLCLWIVCPLISLHEQACPWLSNDKRIYNI